MCLVRHLLPSNTRNSTFDSWQQEIENRTSIFSLRLTSWKKISDWYLTKHFQFLPLDVHRYFEWFLAWFESDDFNLPNTQVFSSRKIAFKLSSFLWRLRQMILRSRFHASMVEIDFVKLLWAVFRSLLYGPRRIIQKPKEFTLSQSDWFCAAVIIVLWILFHNTRLT